MCVAFNEDAGVLTAVPQSQAILATAAILPIRVKFFPAIEEIEILTGDKLLNSGQLLPGICPGQVELLERWQDNVGKQKIQLGWALETQEKHGSPEEQL
jgi:hypothetical protein